MNPDISYRLSLLGESMQVSGELLLIRMHLKQMTIEERYALKQRAAKIQELIKQARDTA